ncbi:hypothetical protein GCM10022239_17270 [Leifsonia bigeumensis]|uniref:Uncharacterized protein n=1 Tax=Leifsonella bigeumensis TaxID=433643 RepID=A0ABP7FMB4_9MICO
MVGRAEARETVELLALQGDPQEAGGQLLRPRDGEVADDYFVAHKLAALDHCGTPGGFRADRSPAALDDIQR